MPFLRPGERTVLAVLTDARGRVVSREQLARRAGLRDASPRRVDAVIVELRKALGEQAIQTVRGRGWRLAHPLELEPKTDSGQEAVPLP